MRTATNQIGYVVQRFDGPVVGWVAITEPTTRDEALQQHADLVRTSSAEYRVYPSLKDTHEA